jgi:hypothetical protein
MRLAFQPQNDTILRLNKSICCNDLDKHEIEIQYKLAGIHKDSS